MERRGVSGWWSVGGALHCLVELDPDTFFKFNGHLGERGMFKLAKIVYIVELFLNKSCLEKGKLSPVV